MEFVSNRKGGAAHSGAKPRMGHSFPSLYVAWPTETQSSVN